MHGDYSMHGITREALLLSTSSFGDSFKVLSIINELVVLPRTEKQIENDGIFIAVTGGWMPPYSNQMASKNEPK